MQVETSLQSKSLFGNRQAHWYTLEPDEFRFLGLPRHFEDQVFRILFAKCPAVHLFEITVSHQCPKDAYTHLIRGIGKLRIQSALINVVHGQSAGSHLMVWDRGQPLRFHHIDFDFAHLTAFHHEVLTRTRTPHSANITALMRLVEGRHMGDRFFRTLKNHLRRIPCKNAAESHTLVDLVLKLIFLILVQRKGWLNFDPFYLMAKMRLCRERNLSILHCFLVPLFARLEGFRIREPLPLGDLPRLGGGMFAFAPENLPVISNHWILTLYRKLVSRYAFSLFETREGRHVVGIGPEMLGHVFENLLFDDDRKRHGVFYTPAEVAEKQVRASLAAYVRNHTAGGTSVSRQQLRQIRILDPSCGSGTYLVAAFQALLKLHLERAPAEERFNGKLYRLKRRIMLENLFGLDIHPMAIRLTEVRLWLNMIQDLEIQEPGQAPSLPNLQHHLRPGDFLGRHLPDARRIMSRWPKHQRLEQLRARFPKARANAKQGIFKHILRLEAELSEYLAKTALAEHHLAIRNGSAQKPLPGHAPPPRVITKAETAPACFPVHVVFSQVMLNGGFDLIVGNPPWLSAGQMLSGEKQRIRQNLIPPVGLKLTGQIDLSLYFLLASLNLLKPQGALGFLMPNKILQASFADELRAYLKREFTVDYLFDYGIDANTLFKADTFPLAMGISRCRPDQGTFIAVERKGKGIADSYRLAQEQLGLCQGIWALGSPREMAHLEKTASWPSLGELPWCIQRGIVTGAKRDFVFTQPPPWLPTNRIKPLLRGRDIQASSVAPGAWIYWPFEDGPHWYELAQEQERAWLSGTNTKKVRSFRADLPYKVRTRPKWMLIWKYLSSQWQTALVSQDWIPDQTTYYLGFRDFREAFRCFCYFNSWLAKTCLRLIAERGKDRCSFFYAHTCRKLPVPPELLTMSGPFPEPKPLFTPAEGKLWASRWFGEERATRWFSEEESEDSAFSHPA